MILDTNALSAFADGDEGIRPLLEAAACLAIPSIVLGEYFFGVLQSRHRRDYEVWLKEVVHEDNLLMAGAGTARLYAEIRMDLKKKGHPLPYHAIWIGALALEYGLPVLTRDAHFDHISGLQRLSW